MANYEHFVDVEASSTVGSRLLSVVGPVLVGLGLAVLGAAPVAVGLSTAAVGIVAVAVARRLDRRARAENPDAAAGHAIVGFVSWAVAIVALLAGMAIQAGTEFSVAAATLGAVLTVDAVALVQKTGPTAQRLRATIQVALFAAATVYAILGGHWLPTA